MQLYIMRHGEAQPILEQGSTDCQRALTQQGKTEVNLVAHWFKKKHINLNTIFVSPYVRAQQTAQIANAKIVTKTSTLDLITPSGDAKQVHDFIDGWCEQQIKRTNQSVLGDDENNLLIISHMPLVSYLVAQLTQSTNAPIFATAAIAHIDYDEKTMRGRLKQLISPLDLD
jgi:phosphohistidine phosphatase